MSLTASRKTQQEPYVHPVAQGRAFFDREARRVTGLSGEEFLRRYDAGEIAADDDTPEGREIGYLILLIPFGR
jgi:hypothetical protein